MSPKQIVRVLLVSGSAMMVAIVFTTLSPLSMEGAVGLAALLTAVSYELTHWQRD